MSHCRFLSNIFFGKFQREFVIPHKIVETEKKQSSLRRKIGGNFFLNQTGALCARSTPYIPWNYYTDSKLALLGATTYMLQTLRHRCLGAPQSSSSGFKPFPSDVLSQYTENKKHKNLCFYFESHCSYRE